MNEIRVCIQVDGNHQVSGTVPDAVPPGEHDVTINVGPAHSAKHFRLADMPIHDVPWDGSVSLRREDMYGDDGR